MNTRRSLLLTASVVCSWSTSRAALAQATRAELRGTVEDSSAASVVGATITATDIATKVARTSQSNDQGAFDLNDLAPATYEVVIGAAGFDSVRYEALKLEVGASQVLRVKLKPQSTTSVVEVSAIASGVELANSSLSGVVDSRTVRTLPLNGRDYTSLAALEPGVNVVRTQNSLSGSSSNRGSRGLGTQVSVDGNRPTQNNYFVDGISVNDYANGSPGGATGLALGVEAVQEFSVVTNSPDATYGQAAGGIINAITRSGADQFHGNLYDYLRNSYFDAKGYFDPAVLPLRRNQFGASLGGPILRQRTFFFLNFEQLRLAQSSTTTSTVFSSAARASAVAAVRPYLALFPLGNGAISTTDPRLQQYTFVASNPQNDTFGSASVDQKVTQNNSLRAVYSVDDSITSLPDSLNAQTVTTTLRRNTVSIADTHTFSSSLLNLARVGMNRVTTHALQSSPGNNPAATNTALGILPGRNAPSIAIPGGITTFNGGVGGLATTNFAFTNIQVYDDLTKTYRSHTFKMGGDFVHFMSNMQVAASANGAYTFKTVAGFLANTDTTNFGADLAYAAGQTSGVPTGFGFPERGFRQNYYGVYFQDDWRIVPTLTLNLGLRYEFATVPTEQHQRLSNLYDIRTTNLNAGAQLFQNPTKKSLEPRVGFAWDPYGNQRVAIRGGAGMYDVLPGIHEVGLQESYAAPFSTSVQVNLPAGAFPAGGYNLLASGVNVPLRAVQIQSNPGRNYVVEYNTSVQAQITPNTTFLLAYAGSRGVHMSAIATDINYNTPVLTAAGYQFQQGTRNANLGLVRQITWTGNAHYNGLQAILKKRISRGFQYQASFTWQSSIDDFSSTSFPTQYQNSTLGLLFDRRLNRGPSDFNVTKAFVMNGLWDLPKVKTAPAYVRAVTNGWTAAGLWSWNTGLPFTPLVGGDALGEGASSTYNVPNYVPNNPGCNGNKTNGRNLRYINTSCYAFAGTLATNGVLGNARRNSIVGPGYQDVDLSVERNFPLPFIDSASRLQFRADVFNVANHANFQAPLSNNTLFTATSSLTTAPALSGVAGLINNPAGSNRQMQFALKLFY